MQDAFASALANTGAGAKTAFNKYSTPGTSFSGTIVSREIRQKNDFKTGAPMTWNDGNPVMQAVIIIQTALREEQDDDGKRALYVNWYGDDLRSMKAAIQAAGGPLDLAVGGFLTQTFTGDLAPTGPGLSGKKVYTFTYGQPSLMDTPDMSPQAAQQPDHQQQAPAAAPVAGVPGQAPSWATGGPATAPVHQPPAQQQYQQPAATPDPWSGQQQAPQQQYQPPVQVNTNTGEILSPPPAQQPAQQQQAPAPQFAAPVPQVQQHQPTVDVAQIQAGISAGATDQQINAATGASFEQIAAVRNIG